MKRATLAPSTAPVEGAGWFRRFTIRRDNGEPYMTRTFLLRVREAFAVYLHEFHADDEETPHDHPWDFVSVVLSHGYVEDLYAADGLLRRTVRRGVGSVAFRRAETIHRVTLPKGRAWTLVLRGPRRREWGFVRPGGLWTHWQAWIAEECRAHAVDWRARATRAEELIAGAAPLAWAATSDMDGARAWEVRALALIDHGPDALVAAVDALRKALA